MVHEEISFLTIYFYVIDVINWFYIILCFSIQIFS